MHFVCIATWAPYNMQGDGSVQRRSSITCKKLLLSRWWRKRQPRHGPYCRKHMPSHITCSILLRGRFVCCSKNASMDRLSGALRELAAALEEVSEEAEWEVVEPKSSATPEPDGARRGPRARASALRAPPGSAPTSSSAPPSSSCAGKSTPTHSSSRLDASSSREPPDTSRAASSGERVRPSTWGATPRHYLVLFSPKDRTLEGHWFGPWAKLEPLVPGAKFCGSAVQLRKMTSKAMAEREWAAVHGSRPMPSRELT